MADFEFLQTEHHDCHAFLEVRVIRSCFCRLVKWSFPDLSSPFWRWYWNDTPGASIVVAGSRIPLTPDHVLLIPPYTVFASRTTRPVGHLYMHFAIETPRAPTAGRVHRHPCGREDIRTMRRLITALERAGNAEQPEVSFLSHMLVNRALLSIPADAWGERSGDARLEDALRLIDAAAPRALGNPALARHLGMNVNAFTRLFRQHIGLTPHQYLLRRRMELAHQLLQYSAESIDLIAEKTGFCDRFHFSRAFKRHFHSGPSAFRRRARRQAE